MSPYESGAFDPIDPADMEDELRERSESIDIARDAAFDRGYEEYTPGGDRLAAAQSFYPEHVVLRRDFADGWDDAHAAELVRP